MKLNLGAGSDIRQGWVNHDVVKLDGIDVVHNLNITPWPWLDSSIDELHAMDILEHLDDFMRAMEACVETWWDSNSFCSVHEFGFRRSGSDA